MKPSSGVWHIGYNGPRCVLFIQRYENKPKNKALVTFNGVPEIVDEVDLFETQAECLKAAGLRKLKDAARINADALELIEAAARLEDEEAERSVDVTANPGQLMLKDREDSA